MVFSSSSLQTRKSFKFLCSSLHRFTTVCDTRAHCKILSKDNDGVLFTLFTSVCAYRMCIPWWNSPSVFDVTVWFHLLFLSMPCSGIALFSTYQQQTLQWNSVHTKYTRQQWSLSTVLTLANQRITTLDSYQALHFQTIFIVKFWKIH